MTIIKQASFAVMLTVGCIGTVSAAGIVTGSEITQKTDVTFASTSDASVTLTPVKDLKAGTITTLVTIATGSVKVPKGNVAIMRWTPGTNVDASNKIEASIPGTGDASNKLNVSIWSKSGSWPAKVDDGWYKSGAFGTNVFDYEINAKPQTIAADTYTLSIDGAVWQQ